MVSVVAFKFKDGGSSLGVKIFLKIFNQLINAKQHMAEGTHICTVALVVQWLECLLSSTLVRSSNPGLVFF